MYKRTCVSASCALAVLATSAWAQSAAKSAPESPSHAVLVLQARCLPCHGGAVKRSGLDLSTRDSLLRGGDRGPGVVPGDPENSLLYQVIAHKTEPHMPYKGDKLPADAIADIGAWIKEGAAYSAPLTITTARPVDPAVRNHWAFQPPNAAAVPKVKNAAFVRNPIDAFIVAEQEKRGLMPAPAADKRTLLRRVYLDVIGLPPTREEIEAFVADPSPRAYEKVVDKLLASPRYGERWGRHWMDIWRYSDWYGWRKQNEVRYSQRHIWHWRDWIVDSLNEDKGYDRMIVEMLAGDEVAPSDPQTLRATGYLARTWERYSHNSWLQNTVDHTAAGFLGLTLKCARCHDHKYDPFTQEEYYRFRAFFEPYDVRADRLPGQPDTEKNGLPRAFDAKLDEPTFRFIRGNEDNPQKDKPLSPGTPAVLGGSFHIEPVSLKLETYYPDFRSFVQRDVVEQAKTEIQEAEAGVRKANDELAAAKQGDAAKLKKAEIAAALAQRKLESARTRLPALEARVAADKARFASPPAANTEALALAAKKAELTANLAKVQEAVLSVDAELQDSAGLSDPDNKEAQKRLTEARKQLKVAQDALEARADYTPVGTIYPDSSTGRRLALAKWIANRQNPLTARVAVNDIWLRHFGKALVPTVENFGLNGKPPTHPALLDWLAVQLMESNWSMKALHRLILTSNTYRMQSAAGPHGEANLAIDPENMYLWHMNSRRMEAEVVRDSLLAAAGQLDTTMGGPELDEKAGQSSHRRSLYFRQAPDLEMPFLKIFDGANPIECYERGESVVPQQALALVNSKLSSEMAKTLTESLSKDIRNQTDAVFARAVFETVLGREPAAEELLECRRFLHSQEELLGNSGKLTPWLLVSASASTEPRPNDNPQSRARRDLVQALFSHNDFVTIR